jgi:hypothetical protein
VPCKGTVYRIAETYQMVDSVLKKCNTKPLFFMDNVWLLLIRNANGQNINVSVMKTPVHLLKFP